MPFNGLRHRHTVVFIIAWLCLAVAADTQWRNSEGIKINEPKCRRSSDFRRTSSRQNLVNPVFTFYERSCQNGTFCFQTRVGLPSFLPPHRLAVIPLKVGGALSPQQVLQLQKTEGRKYIRKKSLIQLADSQTSNCGRKPSLNREKPEAGPGSYRLLINNNNTFFNIFFKFFLIYDTKRWCFGPLV